MAKHEEEQPACGEVEARSSGELGRASTRPNSSSCSQRTTTPPPHQITSTPSMGAARAVPLLICSLGNPGSTYANTLHSAGHTVITRLADHLGSPAFHKDRALGNGLVSKIGDWTLWQSTSYMNDSGKGIREAWRAWSRSLPDEQGKLVVIHDELEKPLGSVTMRTAKGASAKGHNGLKSMLSTMGDVSFARIGVGIGRPTSRDSEDVARYVLRKMTPLEKATIDKSIDEVISKLEQLETR